MSEPSIHHIERARLPWRHAPDLTECGLPVVNRDVWTRADVLAHVKKWGKQRTAMFVCVTCSQTASRYTRFRYGAPDDASSWETDPIETLRRACDRVEWRDHDDERKQMERELRALEVIVEAHRDEFDAYVDGLAETVDLGARIAARNYVKRGFGAP